MGMLDRMRRARVPEDVRCDGEEMKTPSHKRSK